MHMIVADAVLTALAATEVLDYSSDRSPDNYKYHPSPDNWRVSSEVRRIGLLSALIRYSGSIGPANNDHSSRQVV